MNKNNTNLLSDLFSIIDLTHTIDATTRVWDGSCGFAASLTGDYKDGGFRGMKYEMRSCAGTHMDLPAHCYENGINAAILDIEKCIVPAYVIDVSDKAHEDYEITLDDVNNFEKMHGTICANSVVFFATGWSKKWNNPIEFRNEKDDGTCHFPYISEKVAQLLLERNIAGIGVETLSPDPFYKEPRVHRMMLGAGKYIIENVASLDKMPPKNSFVISLPLKISGGVESPLRLIGLFPKK